MPQTYISAELRRLVHELAADACEYCLIPEAFTLFLHEMDHIIAQQHGGETVEGNLALACVICN